MEYVKHESTPTWSGLDIDVEARGPTEEDVFITVTYNDDEIEGLVNTNYFRTRCNG